MTTHTHEFDETFWDERYRSAPSVWSHNPNPHLVSETADLPPGAALDVGCGEGADAIWLAQHGWTVTAIDLSTVALDRAAARARELGVDGIEWSHVDVTAGPIGGPFDLVSAQFVHLPSGQRSGLHRLLAEAVRIGGTLLVGGHHPADLDTSIQRPPAPDLYFTASDVAADLPDGQWEVVVDDTRPRAARDQDGRPVTIHDAVLLARRNA